jgi:hypothetical protein
MDEVTRRAFYLTACLTGTIPDIPKEVDPLARLLHYQLIISLTPFLADDPACPLAFFINSWLSLLVVEHEVNERTLVVRILVTFFKDLKQKGRAVGEVLVGSTLTVLVRVSLGFAVEQSSLVKSCLEGFVDILEEWGGSVHEEKLILLVSKLKHVKVDGLAEIIKGLFDLQLPHSVLGCVFDVVALNANRQVIVPIELAKCKCREYLKNQNIHIKELLFLANHVFSSDDQELKYISCALLEIVESVKVIADSKVVAFDANNLNDINYILDHHEGLKTRASDDLLFTGDIVSFAPIFRKCLFRDRFETLIEDNRYNLEAVIKYCRLYIEFEDIDWLLVATLLVDLDDVVECAVNQHLQFSFLKLVNIYLQKLTYNRVSDVKYNIVGACLLATLPKLLDDDHLVRQIGFDNLCLLAVAHGEKNRCTIRTLIGEYRVYLLEACQQQMKSPTLYPHAPQILVAIFRGLKSEFCLHELWSFILYTDDLLETKRGGLSGKYISGLIDVMSVSIELATRSERVVVSKPRVTDAHFEIEEEGEEERAQLKTLNDLVVEKAFEACFNLLSNQHPIVKKRCMSLLEQCCEYYERVSTTTRDTFLPCIHKLWDMLWCRLCDKDARVSNVACTTLSKIISFDVGFVRGRMKRAAVEKLLKRCTADAEKVIELLTRMVEAELELELASVESVIEKYPCILGVLEQSRMYDDIAWYHRHFV